MPASLAQPHPRGQHDRPLQGILLSVLAGMAFTGADAFSKKLALTLPVVEVSWLRWCGLLVATLPVLVWSRGRVLVSRATGLQICRALMLVGSSVLFTAGLSGLPLASATTINFVSPLLVTALSIPILGESVGIRRWAAIAVGLGGVLIVVRPGSGTFGAAAIFPILSAACWALAVILTRKVGGIDPPWTSMSYAALVGFAVLTAVSAPDFVLPNATELGLGLAMATLATAAQFLTLMAFTRAPASTIAPFSYVMLIWASVLGFVVFGNVPDGWTWVGAAVIIASGLYTAHRERLKAKATWQEGPGSPAPPPQGSPG